MSVWTDVAPEDWQQPEGAPVAELVMQAVTVTSGDPAGPEWVQVHGWHHLRVEGEMPEWMTYLVRWDALPAEAQALLKAEDRAREGSRP